MSKVWNMTKEDLTVTTPVGDMKIKNTSFGTITVSFETDGRTIPIPAGIKVVSLVGKKQTNPEGRMTYSASYEDAKRDEHQFEFLQQDGGQVILNDVHLATIHRPQPLVRVSGLRLGDKA